MILAHKIKLKGCIFVHKFSYARVLIRTCREWFLECRVSKTKQKSHFLTKIPFWDVEVKFPLFRWLLTLRMDFYCHLKYVRYLHTLGVKTHPSAEIYLISFSVRRALKVPFLNSWDIFSTTFQSIFLIFCRFFVWKIFLNPTYW